MIQNSYKNGISVVFRLLSQWLNEVVNAMDSNRKTDGHILRAVRVLSFKRGKLVRVKTITSEGRGKKDFILFSGWTLVHLIAR